MIGPFDFMMLRKRRALDLESRIDNALRDAVDSNALRAVTVAIKGYHRSVVDQVAAHYREKGWKVDIVDDSRDGDFISLELP